MIDIVERLRRTIAANESGKFHLLMQEAADEIERLRAELETGRKTPASGH